MLTNTVPPLYSMDYDRTSEPLFYYQRPVNKNLKSYLSVQF